jgi:hypothetical protein
MIKRASTSEAALIPVVTRTQVSPTSFNLASAAQVTKKTHYFAADSTVLSP